MSYVTLTREPVTLRRDPTYGWNEPGTIEDPAIEYGWKDTVWEYSKRASWWATKKAASFAITASMPLAIISVAMPVSTHGRIAHATNAIHKFFHWHPPSSGTSDLISASEFPRAKDNDSLIDVVFETPPKIPASQEVIYNALRKWALIENPDLKQLDYKSLSETYDFFFLDDSLDREEMRAFAEQILPHIEEAIAANHSPVLTRQEKIALAIINELNLLGPNDQQRYARVFRANVSDPLVRKFLDQMLEKAREGQSLEASLTRINSIVATYHQLYRTTWPSYERARANGLLGLMQLTEQIAPHAKVVDELTVSLRETGLDINQMGQHKDPNQTAKGPIQATLTFMHNLVVKYNADLLEHISAYHSQHPHLAGNDQAWIDYTTRQLREGASTEALQNNYLVQLAENSESVAHDEAGLIKWMKATFSTEKTRFTDADADKYLPHAERIVLINFIGLTKLETLVKAFFTPTKEATPVKKSKHAHVETPAEYNIATPVRLILGDAVMKRNKIDPKTTVGGFITYYGRPSYERWFGFQLNINQSPESAPARPYVVTAFNYYANYTK